MNAPINLVFPTPVANEKQMLGNSLSKSENFLTSSNAISFSDNFDIFFRKEKKLFLLTF